MTSYTTTVRADSPLAVSLGRATGNDLATLPFIPGTSLRGAAAQAYLDEGGDPGSPGFKAIFLEGQVRFGELRIDGASAWPLSARCCRNFGARHLIDLLITAAVMGPVVRECQVCGGKLEPPKGFRVRTRDSYEERSTKTRRVAHVQIDPLTLRARTGQFHTSRLIASDQRFEGRISAWGEGAKALSAFLDAERTLYVGRGRTRGQGRLSVRIHQAAAASSGLLDRLRFFNEACRDLPGLGGRVLFSCTLNSAAIVLDRWLFSTSYLLPEHFSPALQDYRLLAWFTRVTKISGWHAAAGLPKAEVGGIEAGASFLFARPLGSEDTVDAECARLADLLAPLEDRGIGERFEEGFGEIVFCDPFHIREGAHRRVS